MNMEKFNYIYVLDYTTASIYEIKCEKHDRHKNIEDILKEHGCKASNCEWMLVEDKIDDIIRI